MDKNQLIEFKGNLSLGPLVFQNERTCKDSDIGFTDTPCVIVSFSSSFIQMDRNEVIEFKGNPSLGPLILEIKELAEIVSSVFDQHQISSRFDPFRFSQRIMTVSRERKEKEI